MLSNELSYTLAEHQAIRAYLKKKVEGGYNVPKEVVVDRLLDGGIIDLDQVLQNIEEEKRAAEERRLAKTEGREPMLNPKDDDLDDLLTDDE
jgi:uncharacterized protein YehS (DUF1456 family)